MFRCRAKGRSCCALLLPAHARYALETLSMQGHLHMPLVRLSGCAVARGRNVGDITRGCVGGGEETSETLRWLRRPAHRIAVWLRLLIDMLTQAQPPPAGHQATQ